MDVVKSMKIIIADAKSLKEKHFPIEKQTPLFFNKAESLRKQLKELDINQIHDLMKISFKQSSLIYDYFHNEETFAAINLFNGVVFKQLDLKNYQKEEWDYLDKHLLINSPLYGILRYNDAVNYHRLEMPNSNLMFVECKVDGEKMILIMKLNYKVTPISIVEDFVY